MVSFEGQSASKFTVNFALFAGTKSSKYDKTVGSGTQAGLSEIVINDFSNESVYTKNNETKIQKFRFMMNTRLHQLKVDFQIFIFKSVAFVNKFYFNFEKFSI